jgi:hypothetical protein
MAVTATYCHSVLQQQLCCQVVLTWTAAWASVPETANSPWCKQTRTSHSAEKSMLTFPKVKLPSRPCVLLLPLRACNQCDRCFKADDKDPQTRCPGGEERGEQGLFGQ